MSVIVGYVKEAKRQLGLVGKPLKHRFIANKLKEQTKNGEQLEVFPQTVLEIIEKIKQVTLMGSILQEIANEK